MDAQRPGADPSAGASAGMDYVELLRRWVLILLVIGLVGTVTELILLSHYEQPLQLVPVVLIVLALVVLIWHAIGRSTASLRAVNRFSAIDLATPEGVGGPLLNQSGAAIGILIDGAVSAGAQRRLAFAVPIDRVKALLRNARPRPMADLLGVSEGR